MTGPAVEAGPGVPVDEVDGLDGADRVDGTSGAEGAEGAAGTAGTAGTAPPQLLAAPAAAAQLSVAASGWPSHALDPVQLADLELLLCGGYAPLRGYLTAAERAAVERDGRLPDGTPWPLPLALDVAPALADEVTAGDRLAVRDQEGVLIAALEVAEVDGTLLAGPVTGVRLPDRPDYPGLRRTPAALRGELARRAGHGEPLAALTRDPLHTADLERLRAAGRPAVVVGLVGGERPSDAELHVLVRCLGAAVADLAGHAGHAGHAAQDAQDGTGGPEPLLTLVPLPARPAGAAEDALRRLVAANYGLADCLLYPAPGAPTPAEVRDRLDRGLDLPPATTPPAVAAQLRRARPPRHRQGFTVFFTGLSGSGKSTVANLLTVRLLERGDRRVTLLDGDVVRLNLSAGLGFSRADRDVNIRRIGFVAAEVTRAGGVAICAPIAPYDATRRQVRAAVESGGGFVLVHVATPLSTCEARDRKGLYAKARAGLLPEFTGVSDPYEVPADAEVVIDTSDTEPRDGVAQVLEYLRGAGWLADSASRGAQ